MRVSTSLLFQRGLAAIQDVQTGLLHTQQQLATGKRILTPADDPAGAGRALDLEQALALNGQYKANADHAENRLAQEDGALKHVTDLLQRVRELAVQGNNAPLSATDRAAIATEVKQNLEALIGIANTRDANGDYLFAGTTVRTPPFAHSTTGVSYSGDQGARSLQIATGTRIQVGDPGSDVFQSIRTGNGIFVAGAAAANTGTGLVDAGSLVDPALYTGDVYRIQFTSATAFDVVDTSTSTTIASGVPYVDGAAITSIPGTSVSISGSPAAGDQFTLNPSANQDLFATLQGLVDALEISGNSAAVGTRRSNQIGAALSNIDQGLEKMNRMRARVGARLNTIDNERQNNADVDLFLRSNISAVSDVDIAAAITRLTRGNTSLQAAQKSFVSIQNLSLFNFL